MSQANNFVLFLRHYGPIPASDNMYDELIQIEINRHQIDPPIQIEPARLKDLIDNFEGAEPINVILTGTAGDGKTYHCRRVWEHFGGDKSQWQSGKKIATLNLPHTGKRLVIIKDLSELRDEEKASLIPELASAVSGTNRDAVYLVAANDGQLVASWRDWAEPTGGKAFSDFRSLEAMLVEDRIHDPSLRLRLYNLSRMDASTHFDALVDQVTEHSQWQGCQGCELINAAGTTSCPIRLNRELLRGGVTKSPFRQRLSDLLRLAGVNRMHLPIRDLLLLAVNIILGDQKAGKPLLTCRSAKNRAKQFDYATTNPYANVFGSNLPEKERQKYQAFTTLDSFGVGRETDNAFDNLLIYGRYSEIDRYKKLVDNDPYYGGPAYRVYLRDYLEGARESTREFMVALERQRRRLFFSLTSDPKLDPWRLSVYRSAGQLLEFAERVETGGDITRLVEQLVRGLNRTFCGMMIDDGTQVYLASSGGDGRGRIASVLNYELRTTVHRRNIYMCFGLADDGLTPRISVIDPTQPEGNQLIDQVDLQLTHFEYLMRVACGSLPASFSRQCYEDFLDFKLRLIERLDELIGNENDEREVALRAITVDANGRPLVDDIRIRVGAQ